MADAPVSPRLRHVARVPKSYLARMLGEKDGCEMPTAHFDSAM
jgi:hypothetical protein